MPRDRLDALLAKVRRLRHRWLPSFEYRAVRKDGDCIETDWGWALHFDRQAAEEELEMHEIDLDPSERGGRVERRVVGPWLHG